MWSSQNSQVELITTPHWSYYNPKTGVNLRSLDDTKKGVIFILKFLLHFWSYSNSHMEYKLIFLQCQNNFFTGVIITSKIGVKFRS